MSDSLPDAGAGPDAVPAPPDPDAGAVDPHLRAATLEIEAHAADAGWDQAARLFALVPTGDLLAREPGLAEALGVAAAAAAAAEGALTPVEQDSLPPDRALEDVLDGIMWPAEVFGCAAVVERLVLPPSADDAMPEDAAAAQEYAAAHPDTRGGATYCTLRMRAHDDDASVLEGTDLVPGLLELLHGTLEQ
jgi:hypothetical protein